MHGETVTVTIASLNMRVLYSEIKNFYLKTIVVSVRRQLFYSPKQTHYMWNTAQFL